MFSRKAVRGIQEEGTTSVMDVGCGQWFRGAWTPSGDSPVAREKGFVCLSNLELFQHIHHIHILNEYHTYGYRRLRNVTGKASPIEPGDLDCSRS